jgi:hypothetical protein
LQIYVIVLQVICSVKFGYLRNRKPTNKLRNSWLGVFESLEIIRRKSFSVIKTLTTALLGTGNHLKEVLSTILSNLRLAFNESLIKGLLEISKSVWIVVKEMVKISASTVAIFFGIILYISGSYRGLNIIERSKAAKVFGRSIDLDNVRLSDSNLAVDFVIWMNGNRPFVTMYFIHYKSGTTLKMDVLIQELVHIRQAVTLGGVYMVEALYSQFFGKGYFLSDEDVKKANGKFLNLEREQQAVLIQEYWKIEFDGQKGWFSSDLLKPIARQVYKPLIILKSILR